MFQVSTLNKKQFNAAASETLLAAALRSDVLLEHSCKTGRCGACKVQVPVGSTIAVMDEVGLTLREKLTGWVLTCARTALCDLQLSVEDLGGLRLHPAKTIPCRIQGLERLAPDVVLVRLRLPTQQDFRYHPGQYVDVIGPGGVRRSYSIANAPAPDQLIELHIRRVDGGAMSEYWFERAKLNDLLRLNGPSGTFVLRDVVGMDLVFLATGTGIAPVKAMLESFVSLPVEAFPRSVRLYWGGRSPVDLYWTPKVPLPGFSYTPVLSRTSSHWHGFQGYVQQALLADVSDFSNAVVYACGSPEMITSAREQILAAGLAVNRFRSDAFLASNTINNSNL